MSEAVQQAHRWIDAQLDGGVLPNLVVLVGLGHGHILDALMARHPDVRVLAVEPERRNAAAILGREGRGAWLQSGRLVCLLGPTYAGAEQATTLFDGAGDRFQLLVEPALTREVHPTTVAALHLVKRLVFGARANAEAKRRFAPGALTNTLRNLPRLVTGVDVRALSEVHRGQPAVIVGAGPSLDAVAGELESASNRGVIIAADTALRPLLCRGITPDYVVALDPGERNARHFAGLPGAIDARLVAEPSVNPATAAPFAPDPCWFRVGDHHPWPWLHSLDIDSGHLPVWGSVITAAFQLAVRLGCDPIIFVGADLAFTGGRPYCRGTTYEFDAAIAVAEGRSLDEVWQGQMRQVTQVADWQGAPTPTADWLVAFRDWLVSAAATSGRRVINATGGGILAGPSIEQRHLAEVFAHAAPRPRSRHAAPSGDRARRTQDVRTAVRRTLEHLQAQREDVAPIAEWRTSLGDGWDADAVLDALESAAGALDDPGTGDRCDGDGEGPGSGSVSTVHPLLPQLPEALARWRAWRSPPTEAAADVHPLSCANREALLVDAGAILAAAAAALDRSQLTRSRSGHRDEGSPGDATSTSARVASAWASRRPLSSCDHGPEPRGWVVVLFEALLGAATRAPAQGGDLALLTRPVCPRDTGVPLTALPADAPGPEAEMPFTLLLALEWLMAAGDEDAPTVMRLQGLGARAARDAPATATIVVDVHNASRDVVRVSCPVDLASCAALLTGWLQIGNTPTPAEDEATQPTSLLLAAGAVEADGRRTSVEVRIDIAGGQESATRSAGLLTPRVLTDEWSARANLVYARPDGVVCVTPYARESILVHEDGSVMPWQAWPLPIVGEVAFGDDGAVAWSHAGRDGVAEAAYVMYRPGPDAPVTIESLAFRPNNGVCADRRVWWTCLPGGVVCWEPGAPARTFLPDRTFSGIVLDDDGAIALEPCVRSKQGQRLRTRASEQWTLRKDDGQAAQAHADGAVSGRSAIAYGWRASAFPEADVIQFEKDGEPPLRMTCYCPFRVEWVGRTLFVSTLTAELLAFPDLVSRLEEATGVGTPEPQGGLQARRDRA